MGTRCNSVSRRSTTATAPISTPSLQNLRHAIMVMVDLKGIHTVTSKGRTYYYAWRGGPRLRGEPGSPEFHASYNEAIQERRTPDRSEEHTSELQSRLHLVCRRLLEKKKAETRS